MRWLDPHQLVDTAVRVLLSGVFSAYADYRELQALEPAEIPDRSGQADHATERGRILVMGGDQVYPVPKAAEYQNRMLGPYRAALPCAVGEAPELFAIPGSHDWYDGLVNFTSIFCRKRWIGGWKTVQRRSYFALKLPNRWWLWGVDIQFGSYIDEAQLRYFAGVALSHVEPGDRIILCTAKEVDSGRKGTEIHSDRDVEFLECEIITPCGARLVLYLKSGKHYYARYEQEDAVRQHITSGGGPSYIPPTTFPSVWTFLAQRDPSPTAKPAPTRHRRKPPRRTRPRRRA